MVLVGTIVGLIEVIAAASPVLAAVFSRTSFASSNRTASHAFRRDLDNDAALRNSGPIGTGTATARRRLAQLQRSNFRATQCLRDPEQSPATFRARLVHNAMRCW
jgi:hypothetical protein